MNPPSTLTNKATWATQEDSTTVRVKVKHHKPGKGDHPSPTPSPTYSPQLSSAQSHDAVSERVTRVTRSNP